MEKQSDAHDQQIIVEAASAGHVLEQAAAAANKNITAANSRCDSEKVHAVNCMYVVMFPGHLAVARNDRNLHVGHDVPQGADNSRQHGLVAGVGKSVIAGNNDLTHGASPAFPANS